MVVGSIIPFAGSTIPTGFLVCDGRAVDRSTYSQLFDVIGTTYGSGDGLSTFNLPNFTGRTVVGASQTLSIGDNGGEETHSLLATEFAEHDHDIPGHGHSSTFTFKTPELTHTVTQPATTYTGTWGTVNANLGSGINAYTGSSSAAMTRSTNLSVAAHAAAACTVTGGVTDAPAFDTESTGLAVAHDNMMPYLTLTYLIYSPETVYPPGMVYFNGAMVIGPSGAYLQGRK
jgi:microcystin-dependent protein